ncbi:glycosyltransferase family 2 protein [Autumnicola psychrophila]|uniref:Glycosyltransferase family 2 protein n=1 Tax=Autumnicola psychrophila TaxID=3075592 RepID=A0ABU3DT45_9FLAO|nr:glycosyltransferase family 2 protein [Zunongwangia sp. F225]MDT0686860.1 glycosyltransferase family 2 protein [Zunongwangia sp. F225]
MKIKESVSIIIPVYNRAYLIGETLESILSQAYHNWECLVVDDGSTDGTLEVLKSYHKKDERIKYYTRPDRLPKGANSCRNFGFEKSTGDYIIWFDSDDLMTPDHISSKLDFIIKNDLDFVVAKTQNFQADKMLEAYTYEKKEYGIKASDFILLKIHWYTYDVMLKRKVAEQINWNERMRSWQDYNYFCKMLFITENGDYLEKILTHRRLHKKSIQTVLTKNEGHFKKELIENRYHTFRDLENKIGQNTKTELIYGLMNLSYEIRKLHNRSDVIIRIFPIVKEYLGKVSLFYFKASLVVVSKFGKGFFLLEKAKSRK